MNVFPLRSIFLLLCCPFQQLLGIVNCDTAAQTADKVLIQVVDQFEETCRDINTHYRDAAVRASRQPSASEIVKGGADAEDFCVLDSNNVSLRIEDWCARKAVPHGSLKENCVDWFRSKRGLEGGSLSHGTLQHDAAHTRKRWNDEDRIPDIYLVPIAQCDVGHIGSINLQHCRIVVDLVARNLNCKRCRLIGSCPTDHNNLDIVSMLCKTRLFSCDDVVGRNNQPIAGCHKSDSTEDRPIHINLYNRLAVDPIDFLPGQHLFGVCGNGENQKANNDTQCPFHGEPPIEIYDPMPSIAYFYTECK